MQSISFSQLEIQATREYWTPERIVNATPASLLGMKMPEGRQQKYDEFIQAEREVCFCASGSSVKDLSVADVDKPPFCKAGRLYYVSAGGQDIYATAQFVGDNILLTAAQCFKAANSEREKNDGWSTNILFQRAYKDSKSAQDTGIVVGAIHVPPEWGSGDGFDKVKYNYGFAITVENSQVGFLGFSSHMSMPDSMTAIGYTKNHDNNERFMYKIKGKKGQQKDGAVALIGNDMDYGAVGGAWLSGSIRSKSSVIYGLSTWRDPDGSVFGPVLTWRASDEMHRLRNKFLPHVPAAAMLSQSPAAAMLPQSPAAAMLPQSPTAAMLPQSPTDAMPPQSPTAAMPPQLTADAMLPQLTAAAMLPQFTATDVDDFFSSGGHLTQLTAKDIDDFFSSW